MSKHRSSKRASEFASAKKPRKAAPATPKAKKPASEPAEAFPATTYVRGPGKGRGCVIEVPTEADHADLADAAE